MGLARDNSNILLKTIGKTPSISRYAELKIEKIFGFTKIGFME
jgi:hypothetical protein